MIALNPVLASILDLAGLFVFALSGALVALRHRFDIIGLLVLAEITAIGGGVLRDLIIGAVPPAAFTNAVYFLIPLAAALLVFFAHPLLGRIAVPVLVTDAAGLALYSVAGAAKALAHGLGPLPALALGAISAVGGGVIRDVLAGETPTILSQESELYAIPATLGATIIVLAQQLHLGGGVGGGAVTAVAVLAAFVLRLLAIWRHWRAPRPLWRGKPDGSGRTPAAPSCKRLPSLPRTRRQMPR
jgi:uncharacterized membrane protein YeiH